jgi:hypothetical protein
MAARRRYTRDRVDAATVEPAAPAAADVPAAGATPGEPNPLVEQLAALDRAEELQQAGQSLATALFAEIDRLKIPDEDKAKLKADPQTSLQLWIEARAAQLAKQPPAQRDDGPVSPGEPVTPETNVRIRQTVAPEPGADAMPRLRPPPLAAPMRRTAPVSAPVSRIVPDGRTPGSRGVQLSAEQREAARISGISDFEYAKNFQELERRKALGMYQDRG